MTHDPLCPQPKCDYGSFNDDACHGFSECPHRCQCDLIAKVRADQDRIHREEMQSLVLAARKERP